MVDWKYGVETFKLVFLYGIYYRSVPQIRPRSVPQICPPFCNLVQNAGGAYMRDATISLTITPSLPGMKSLSVGGGDQAQGITHDASGRLTALVLRSEEAGRLRKVAGVSIVDAGGLCLL